jgi:hypothetical protein
MATDAQSSSDSWDEADADLYRNYPLDKQPKVIPGIRNDVSQDPDWKPYSD